MHVAQFEAKKYQEMSSRNCEETSPLKIYFGCPCGHKFKDLSSYLLKEDGAREIIKKHARVLGLSLS